MQTEPDARAEGTRWRPLLTAILFGVLPFSTFLADNASEAEIDAGFLLYPLALVALGLLVVAVNGRRGRAAAERAAVLFAASSFVFFKFVIAKKVAARLGTDSEYLLPLALWAAGFAVVVVVVRRISRHPVTWSFFLVFGALLVATTTYQYVSVAGGEAPEVGGRVPAQVGAAPQSRPDVWFILLDGYGRADVLQDVAGHDNQPFLDDLERRGFDVAEDAAASYPRTVGSLASTLAMDYVIDEGELADLGPLFGAVRGRNATVRSFKTLGYRYAMATDYAEFSCTDAVDVCVYPPDGAGIGGRDVVLDGSPLGSPLRELTAGADSSRQLLAPDDGVRRVLARAGEGPLFAYMHVIAPHPPYRFAEDCGTRRIEDLSQHGWIPAERPLYAAAVRCLNEQLLRAVDLIRQDDPDAVVVLQGDHGPGFEVPLARNANTWTDDQIRQRYALLSAMRAPSGCPGGGEAPAVPANTFRVVLSCITGREIPLLPPRRFSMVYGSDTRVRPLREFDFSERRQLRETP